MNSVCEKGVLYLEKWSQKYYLTSENVINRLKYGKAHAARSRAVVLYDMSFGVQFNSRKVDSMSNVRALT